VAAVGLDGKARRVGRRSSEWQRKMGAKKGGRGRRIFARARRQTRVGTMKVIGTLSCRRRRCTGAKE
jgi:hypothetical protein